MLSFIKKIKNIFAFKRFDFTLDENLEDGRRLSPKLDENINYVKKIFDRCSDVVMREFKINSQEPIRAFLIYIEGMIDKNIASNNILDSLFQNAFFLQQDRNITGANAFDIIKERMLSITQVESADNFLSLTDYVLDGDIALLFDGADRALICSVNKWSNRSLDEPQSEPAVRGPREGFVESLNINTVLIRRRIKTARLKSEVFKIGRLTKTNVLIFYIDGIVNSKVLQEVRNRLSRIKIDGILESGYIEELIEDDPMSLFPQITTTERPDRMCASLLEGRVGILVDNTPISLIVPATFVQFLQTPEDHYNRFNYATFTRVLRFITLFIALLLPSLYIAVLTFHQEMLPTPLLISIAGQREGVPFPAFIEALMMELVFEFLREAGVRLPRQVGQAISIVGALVIGQAAVSAGLVSSAMVMVVSLTAIAGFTIPTVSGAYAIRLLRFPMMILAASLGLFGVIAGLMGVIIHLCSLRSFGIPYLSPFAPANYSDLKDSVVRAPLWSMIMRPRETRTKEPKRQQTGQKPGPEKDD